MYKPDETDKKGPGDDPGENVVKHHAPGVFQPAVRPFDRSELNNVEQAEKSEADEINQPCVGIMI